MRFLTRVLWLVPFGVHAGYALATCGHMPAELRGARGAGTSVALFFLLWAATIILSNLTFLALCLRLPRMRGKMLSVPRRSYWLSGPEQRAELIQRLRGIVGVAMFGLNVFFLAVYQSIYQANARPPMVFVPMEVLVFFFMVAPLVISAGMMVFEVAAMTREAARAEISSKSHDV